MLLIQYNYISKSVYIKKIREYKMLTGVYKLNDDYKK